MGLFLGEILARRAVAAGFLTGGEILIPVPLHWIKKQDRGFNQADKLIQGIQRMLPNCRIQRALVRRKNTRSQATLSREERIQNVKNAFRLSRKHHNALAGMPVILVDDVITTGSTLKACFQTLIAAGFTDVRALVVAKA